MSYNDDVRAALDPRGFNIDSLRRVARLSFDAIDDGHAAHPVVPFVIAMVCTKVASDWEGEPLDADAARLVETHIGPKLLVLLDASAQDLTGKLDDLVRAYVETREPLAKPLVGRVFLPEAEGTDGQRGGTQRS